MNSDVHLLLENIYAPITSEIGFVQCSIDDTVAAFVAWTERIVREVLADRKGRLRVTPISANLHALLGNLSPLRSVRPNRALFVRTSSDWTAYFDNSARGTDAFPVVSYLAEQLRCRGVRVTGIPDTFRAGKGGRYGARLLEVYGPMSAEHVNVERLISVVNDGGRWIFDSAGTLLPFEDTSAYAERNVQKRFTWRNLESYCRALGLAPFEASFYQREAVLVEVLTDQPRNARYFSLAEVRRHMGLEGE